MAASSTITDQKRITLIGPCNDINHAWCELVADHFEMDTITVEPGTSIDWDSVTPSLVEAQVLVVDLTKLTTDFGRLFRKLDQLAPGCPIIAFHDYTQPALVRSILRDGAAGYLPLNASGEELVEAVHTVLSGRSFTSRLVG